MVDDDAVEPGAEAAVAFEGGELGHQLDQDLLRDVFGVLREINHPQHDVVDPSLMPGDEPFERLAAAGLCLFDQLSIRVVRGAIGQWIWNHSVLMHWTRAEAQCDSIPSSPEPRAPRCDLPCHVHGHNPLDGRLDASQTLPHTV